MEEESNGPDATLIGYANDENGKQVPVFNIIKEGHYKQGSIVTLHTLESYGLQPPAF